VETHVVKDVTVRSTKSGRANAVRITYRIRFSDSVESEEPTDFLLNPQIIFLPKQVHLDQDQKYSVSISYHASSAPLTADIVVG
jgi:hypothetical protein